MSTSDRFYLGVYVEIEHNIIEEHESYLACPNEHDLPYDGHVSFCPECGAKIVEKQYLISRTSKFDLDEILEVEGDDGYPILDVEADDFSVINVGSIKTTWLVQNLTSGKYGRFLDEDTEYGAAPLELDADAIVKKFNNEFEEFLNALREESAAVSVRFGLVHYTW